MCTFDAHFIESYRIFTRDVCNLRGRWAESETTKPEMNITLNIQSIQWRHLYSSLVIAYNFHTITNNYN